jgi:hypothetical protein
MITARLALVLMRWIGVLPGRKQCSTMLACWNCWSTTVIPFLYGYGYALALVAEQVD